MNIIKTISDKNLFRPFLADKNGSLSSWSNWGVFMRCQYGLPLNPKHADLIEQCTGRSINSMPKSGFQQTLVLTGRRSGKSRISSTIAGHEAIFSGKEKYLAKGETGYVCVLAPTKLQAVICKNYLSALFHSTPMLEAEIKSEIRDGFDLNNGVAIRILTGDFRYIRGYTLIACIID